jgi:hypothetical protein
MQIALIGSTGAPQVPAEQREYNVNMQFEGVGGWILDFAMSCTDSLFNCGEYTQPYAAMRGTRGTECVPLRHSVGLTATVQGAREPPNFRSH